MRKIEQKMVDMIQAKKAGVCGGNTFIDILPVTGSMGNDPDKYCVEIILDNTIIARLFINKQTGCVYSYYFDHGGFRTNATKSRLNALSAAFGLASVVQRAGVWYHKGKEF